MAKYLDPKADLTFKKIFGEHKNLVISLLNALLPLQEDEYVESIEYWPTEKIPQRTQVEKDSIVDVCCRDNKRREFIVEMQMTWTEAFKKRVLLNASKAYIAQSEVGEKYSLLQPVYALNFVNAPMNIDTDGYYHHYQLVHQVNSDEVIDGLQLVFIELPKFTPQTISEKKMQVLWLRFLTEINAKTREAPAELLENPEVSQALKIVEEAAYTPAEMRSYNKFWDNVSTQRTLDYARQLEVEAYKAELGSTKAELGSTKAELGSTKAELGSTKAELGSTKAELGSTKAELGSTKAELGSTKAELGSTKAELGSTKAELGSTKAELGSTKAELGKAIKKVEEAEAKMLQDKIDIACKLKAMHLDNNHIAEITGLSIEQIAALNMG